MVWTLIGHFAYFIKSQQCWELSFLHTNERETAWKRGEGGGKSYLPFLSLYQHFPAKQSTMGSSLNISAVSRSTRRHLPQGKMQKPNAVMCQSQFL